MTEKTPHVRANSCGAKTRKGTACGQPAMANGRCRLHGGKSLPAGIGHPTFKTGKYSKDLPTRLASRYAEALADTELLSLRDDVALVDARISELLARIDKGESGRIWAKLAVAKTEFIAARNAHDIPTMDQWLSDILRLIDAGNADWMIVADIVRLQDHKRKLGESERKRLIEMRQIITAEQAAVLLGAITDIIVRNVTDRDTRARISAELTRIADSSTG